MTTATVKGMIRGLTSSDQIGLYESHLANWTTTKLQGTLANVESQLLNSHRDTFGRYCDLRAYKSGLINELRRRGVEIV